jgi:very-short-patch-repair endonuclease
LKKNVRLNDESTPATLKDRARALRGNSTDAERRLWSRLRDGSLGVKFRRQHTIGPFIVDFFSHEAGLVIESDGGQHNEDAARNSDAQRTQYIEAQGYRVLRFWNNEVLTDTEAVLQRIQDFLSGPSPGASRRPLPS